MTPKPMHGRRNSGKVQFQNAVLRVNRPVVHEWNTTSGQEWSECTLLWFRLYIAKGVKEKLNFQSSSTSL